MNYEQYTDAIQGILDELNAALNLDLEFDPAWTVAKDDAWNIDVSYKIHRRAGPSRIMSLSVNTFFAFDSTTNGCTFLRPEAKAQIIGEIKTFWTEGNSEKHVAVSVS
jgi:hypothetical protein